MRYVFDIISYGIALLLLFSAADRWLTIESFIIGLASSHLIPTQFSFYIAYSIIFLKIFAACLVVFRLYGILPYLFTIAISAIYTVIAFTTARSNCGCSRLFEGLNKTENLLILIIITVLSVLLGNRIIKNIKRKIVL